MIKSLPYDAFDNGNIFEYPQHLAPYRVYWDLSGPRNLLSCKTELMVLNDHFQRHFLELRILW